MNNKDLSLIDDAMAARLDSDVQRLSECYYYDFDLKELSENFDNLYKIFKRIRKRAERRQTIQISKSIFDYYSKKDDLKRIPQKYFDFRHGDIRVCLYKYRNSFSVVCVGFDYPYESRREDYYIGVGTPYGSFATYDLAVPLFEQIVKWYLDNFVFDFYTEEVTF